MYHKTQTSKTVIILVITKEPNHSISVIQLALLGSYVRGNVDKTRPYEFKRY